MMARGFEGDDFGLWVVMEYGDDAYTQLASIGPEGLLSFFMSDPEVWAAAAPQEEQLRTFIAEFIEYGKVDTTAEPGGES